MTEMESFLENTQTFEVHLKDYQETVNQKFDLRSTNSTHMIPISGSYTHEGATKYKQSNSEIVHHDNFTKFFIETVTIIVNNWHKGLWKIHNFEEVHDFSEKNPLKA